MGAIRRAKVLKQSQRDEMRELGKELDVDL
jgi:hypothetical protein